MDRVRLVLVGGFLGAGKTTIIGRLAREYVARGSRVAIITNDQASDLVDTHNFAAQGFPVAEVPGSCFCCAFDDLAEAVAKLTAAERPDVLLGEPVGSCTDLVATVVQPLKRLYGDKVWVTPLIVLVDPARARKILTRQAKGGFSPKAAYIYEKQLQEADAIAVNKIDTLSDSEQGQMLDLMRARFPDTPLLTLSGRTGAGLDELRQLVENEGSFGRNIPDVDYDIYAEGEAELGWLNSTIALSAPQPFGFDAVLLQLLKSMQRRLRQEDAEAAHLKMVLESGTKQAIGNLVQSDAEPELSVSSGQSATQARLIVNARVFADPDRLSDMMHETVAAVCDAAGIVYQRQRTQHFRPARPVPTHRYTEPV